MTCSLNRFPFASVVWMILTLSTSEDRIDDLNFGPDENGQATVMVVEDDDFFEEDSMTEISELGCFRSDDHRESECFTSDDYENLICFSPSGSKDS